MICECHTKMNKDGKFKGKQKWECPQCKKVFTEGSKKQLTNEQILMIIKLAHKGTTITAIAEAFRITRQGVNYHLKNNLTTLDLPRQLYDYIIIDELWDSLNKKTITKKGKRRTGL